MQHELIWCAFCEDRPAVGRMVVMKQQSREELGAILGNEGAACDLHGRGWTGTPVAEHEDSGETAVLQYVHPDFSQVTEQHIVDFAGEKTCRECGDPTEEMPLWMAERILRAYPQLVLDQDYRWEGICVRCAHNSSCDKCSEEGADGEHDHDEHDHDEQGHDELHGHGFLH